MILVRAALKDNLIIKPAITTPMKAQEIDHILQRAAFNETPEEKAT